MKTLAPDDNAQAAAARAVCARLREAGHRALLAGGCVRDRLLGHAPKDYDVGTSAPADAVMALFPRTVDVGKAFGVVMVLHEGAATEVTTFRRDGPYLDGRHPASVAFTDEREDALRRDFTINALFLDPETDAVLDYVGGVADLEAGVLRTVGDPGERFREDHLRLMRAVRFAARLGYEIAPDTWAALCAHARLIGRTTAERVRDELLKCLCEGAPKRAFELLDASGLLVHVLPEVAAMKGVEQPPEFHPEGDVFVHTLLLLQELDAPSPTLAMGALLHDVGKPRTQTLTDRIRFNEHDKVGACMAGDICRRLRFSRREAERIVWLVAEHMRVAVIPEMRENKRKRFVRTPGFDELLALCRADCLAAHGDLSTIAWILDYLAELPPEAAHPPPLVTGRDLIALGYAPGKRLGRILRAVEDAQLDGALVGRDEAVAWVQARFKPDAAVD